MHVPLSLLFDLFVGFLLRFYVNFKCFAFGAGVRCVLSQFQIELSGKYSPVQVGETSGSTDSRGILQIFLTRESLHHVTLMF